MFRHSARTQPETPRRRIYHPEPFTPALYAKARSSICSGDVLLWRPTTLMGRLIARGTKAVYSHASMAGWEPNGRMNPNRRLRNVELAQFHGGRHLPLSGFVERYPGLIDVYRPTEPYDGDRALEWILWLCSQDYGWADFALMVVLRGFRWKLPTPADSPDPDLPRVCSAGVAWAIHYGGGRKVDSQKSDFLIFPGELADPFSRYQCTLYWDRLPQDSQEAPHAAA